HIEPLQNAVLDSQSGEIWHVNAPKPDEMANYVAPTRCSAAVTKSFDPATTSRAVGRCDEQGKLQPVHSLVVVGTGRCAGSAVNHSRNVCHYGPGGSHLLVHTLLGQLHQHQPNRAP